MNKSDVSNRATGAGALVVALLAGFALPGATMAQDYGDCLNKRDIQQAIEDGKISPLADVMAQAGINERPLSVQVCEVDGSPHYVVNMMDSYGDGQRIVLNAQDGSQ
jgi:hypothetical protein